MPAELPAHSVGVLYGCSNPLLSVEVSELVGMEPACQHRVPGDQAAQRVQDYGFAVLPGFVSGEELDTLRQVSWLGLASRRPSGTCAPRAVTRLQKPVC